MAKQTTTRRGYLKQSDVPKHGIEDALRVARTIEEECGGQPTAPLMVAKAMELSPQSGHFNRLCGAAAAYGLTEGGARAKLVKLTRLGRRILAPTAEGDDQVALREAVLEPRVIREFLQKYDRHRLPSNIVAANVLNQELGVPKERTEAVLQLIVSSARKVGFLEEIKGDSYVHLAAASVDAKDDDSEFMADHIDEPEGQDQVTESDASETAPAHEATEEVSRDVFISHGSNRKVVEQIKELLELARLKPVVAIEQETSAKPIPHKIRKGMQGCVAAIIHVGTEQRLVDEAGKEHRVLNSNVLIEIGAAMALYADNFILLVEKGVDLPSNLQGLAKITYDGDQLDYATAIKLFKSFGDL